MDIHKTQVIFTYIDFSERYFQSTTVREGCYTQLYVRNALVAHLLIY